MTLHASVSLTLSVPSDCGTLSSSLVCEALVHRPEVHGILMLPRTSSRMSVCLSVYMCMCGDVSSSLSLVML